MERETEFLLNKSARPQEWEDEEKATYDLESLREEFRERLYGEGKSDSAEKRNGVPKKEE